DGAFETIKSGMLGLGKSLDQEFAKSNAAFDKETNDFRRNLDRIDAETARITQSIGENLARVEHSFQDIRAASGRAVDERSLRGLKLLDDGVRRLDHSGSVFTRIGNSVDTFGNKIGKAFGKGSRNDMVNFFGSFVQAPVEIVGAFAKGLGK